MIFNKNCLKPVITKRSSTHSFLFVTTVLMAVCKQCCRSKTVKSQVLPSSVPCSKFTQNEKGWTDIPPTNYRQAHKLPTEINK